MNISKSFSFLSFFCSFSTTNDDQEHDRTEIYIIEKELLGNLELKYEEKA